MLSKPAAILALLLVGGAAQAAFAATQSNAEASALSGVTVTIAEAITAVEAKNQGKVVELALAGTATAPTYNVTVQMPDGTESNFTVNAKTGSVTTGTDLADAQGVGSEQGEPEDGAGGDTGESGESSTN